MVTEAATIVSIIQHIHANVVAHGPQIGTQTKTHISIKVAKPIGMVPKNKEFVGSRIITLHISG